MNKYDQLKRSQLLLAIHHQELALAAEGRQSKRFSRLHADLTQLYAALQRKTAEQLNKWQETPII